MGEELLHVTRDKVLSVQRRLSLPRTDGELRGLPLIGDCSVDRLRTIHYRRSTTTRWGYILFLLLQQFSRMRFTCPLLSR